MSTQRKGFTLVELSIVLIIIGLIIGGVLKGTDLINSAKQKKFYNTFIKGWQIAVNQYQDRTGLVLGDGPANGGLPAGIVNGAFDNVNLGTSNTVQARLRAIGLDVPVTNTGGSAGVPPDGGTYSVEGKRSTSLVTGWLDSLAINGTNKNVLYMTAVPTDVALAIDTMVDGTADAGLGSCRQWNAGAAGATPTTLAWPSAETTATVNMLVVL
ncbi:MAG: prepilin-type N-terminal cleavage/methylation domain-containing protein [Sulfuricurvum sp.]|nr:prepilin-type N-terminal cleavage/methylation domain-containing protein [Sulfuricurvum sp.]